MVCFIARYDKMLMPEFVVGISVLCLKDCILRFRKVGAAGVPGGAACSFKVPSDWRRDHVRFSSV